MSSQLPYRLDLAGTWIDQPMLSSIYPGWALTISLEPIIEYNERSGMATSTRNEAKHIWPFQLPLDKPEKLAEILFRYENKPGNKIISGAQVRIFPNMINEQIETAIHKYKHKAIGWKLSGAGAGGYLILVSDKHIENAMKIKIRHWIE